MKTRNEQKAAKAAANAAGVKRVKRRSPLERMARGALLAVGLTAAQLAEEAEFFGDKFFSRHLVDRLHSTEVTRYHE